ncbi:restriction endonuclease subunit S [Rhodococcus zopfii]|uniref:restriction endonuclease subunit S n=1 Tax=Rhodococcus zopfii TaxID=43772 RepID=UPI0009350399|nr:restriction endonuclease subunit S [Rhodococcus zopfii]
MSKWPKVALGDVAEIVSGGTPKSEVPDYWDGTIPWVTPKDLSGLRGAMIDETPRTITEEGLAKSSAAVLPAGSVLFSSRAPIGHVAINAVPMATNQGFKSFVPKAGVVDAKYLYHWLRANRTYLESLGNGATFKEVSKATVSRIEVPLPPVPQQKRIAAILDHADTLRAKRREAIARLDELTQSIFIDMFGDPSSNSRGLPAMPLRDVVVEGDKINYGVVQPGPDVAVGVRLVRAGDIGDGRVDLRHLRLVSNEVDNKHRRSRLQGDEILISCVGSIGAVALATPELKGCNIARAVARVRVGEDMRREYIAACLSAPGTQRYFTKELRTVAQPTLNIKQIEEAQVIVPTLREQDQFVSRVKEVDRIRSVVLASLVAMDKLFASLQSRAFRGEL